MFVVVYRKRMLVLFLFYSIFTSIPVYGSDYVNFNNMAFLEVPKGSFNMGSCNSLITNSEHDLCGDISYNDTYAFKDELPKHRVTITKNIQIGKRAVSVKEFKKFLTTVLPDSPAGSNDFSLYNVKQDHSVVFVSWEDVQSFITWLNKNKTSSDQGFYRLPTEAEWEYISRAGTSDIYFFGNSITNLNQFGIFTDDSSLINSHNDEQETQPNPWGVLNIYGNVWEWVHDWYAENYYGKSTTLNPQGPDQGSLRVIRGGAANFDSSYCRSATRESYPPQKRSQRIGFRVVRELSVQ